MAGNLQPNGCGKVSYWCRFWTGDALQLTRGLFWNEVTCQKRIWFLNDGCVSNAIWNDPILYLVLPDGWLCDFSVTVASRHSGILPGTLCHACVAGRAFSVRQIVGQEVPRCRADSHFDPDSWVNFVSQGCRGLSLIHLRNRTANDDSKRSIERLLLGVWQGFRTKSATWFQGSTLTPKIGQILQSTLPMIPQFPNWSFGGTWSVSKPSISRPCTQRMDKMDRSSGWGNIPWNPAIFPGTMMHHPTSESLGVVGFGQHPWWEVWWQVNTASNLKPTLYREIGLLVLQFFIIELILHNPSMIHSQFWLPLTWRLDACGWPGRWA